MPEEYVRECGARIALTRRALGMSNAALARLLGITTTALSNYEAGEREMPRLVIAKWKRLRGVTFDWIYGGDISTLPGHLIERIEQISAADPAGSSVSSARRARQ